MMMVMMILMQVFLFNNFQHSIFTIRHTLTPQLLELPTEEHEIVNAAEEVMLF